MCLLSLAGCYGVDIGPRSAFAFSDALERCNTIFWNGPMGKFEVRAWVMFGQHVACAL